MGKCPLKSVRNEKKGQYIVDKLFHYTIYCSLFFSLIFKGKMAPNYTMSKICKCASKYINMEKDGSTLEECAILVISPAEIYNQGMRAYRTDTM